MIKPLRFVVPYHKSIILAPIRYKFDQNDVDTLINESLKQSINIPDFKDTEGRIT
jgi:hypothetical protein